MMWHRVGLSPLVFASAGSDRQSSVVALLFSDGFYQAGSANHHEELHRNCCLWRMGKLLQKLVSEVSLRVLNFHTATIWASLFSSPLQAHCFPLLFFLGALLPSSMHSELLAALLIASVCVFCAQNRLCFFKQPSQ